MMRVRDSEVTQILSREDGPVHEIVRAGGKAGICLICEHASAALPAALGDLGLAPKDRLSHAAYDRGAAPLARALSERLDAPLIMARFSRLAYDLNRPPEREDAMPSLVENIEIPGNRDLTDAERAARADALYTPFHAAVSELLDGFAAPPALVTVHSFTPFWHTAPRATEIGLLHDADPNLAHAMLRASPGPVRVTLNEPYSAKDGVTHTLALHGTARELQNVMIEVRNDLLRDDPGMLAIADQLAEMIRTAADKPPLREAKA